MSDVVNQSTQTFEVLSDALRIELLTLANMLFHSSYWFITLSSLSTRLKLPGFAWALKEKELKCTESALEILNWIGDRGGSLEFADVAKPRFSESDVSSDFVAKRWNDIEDWIEKKITALQDHHPGNKALDELLGSMLKTIKSVAPAE